MKLPKNFINVKSDLLPDLGYYKAYELTSVGNWDTTQMGANTDENHPLWVGATVSISFLVTESTNINTFFTGNIFWGTVSNKDWFTSPFEKTCFT